MPDYRRWYVPGGTYFFTVVTYRRAGFLCRDMARRLLRESIELELENHFDYIHYNPAKHGHVVAPKDWPWSTFHKYVRLNVYSADWGTNPMDFPSVDEDLLE